MTLEGPAKSNSKSFSDYVANWAFCDGSQPTLKDCGRKIGAYEKA